MLEAGLTCRLHVISAAETGAARDEVHQGRRNASALCCAPLPPRLEPRPVVQPAVPERPLRLTCRVQSTAQQLCTLRQVTSRWSSVVVQYAPLPASRPYPVTNVAVLVKDRVANQSIVQAAIKAEPYTCPCQGDFERQACLPGTATGSKTKGMAAEAATASGSAPLSISLYSPFLATTPTANSCSNHPATSACFGLLWN